jgi:hypothetical protein
MARNTYDPTLRASHDGARLYEIWKHMRKSPHTPTWDSFPAFYDWAMGEGYTFGDRLIRIDEAFPYNPANCFWRTPTTETLSEKQAREWCEKWNKTVNILRKHFGLPPLKE